MLNRKVAILPLCFACLMLLAHLAVPHHHHNGTVICLLNFSSEIVAEPHCLEAHHHGGECSHEQGDLCDSCRSHENGGCSNDNNKNNSEENCCIDDLYLVSETKYSLDIEVADNDQDILPNILMAIITNSTGQTLLTGLPFRQKLFFLSYNSLLISGDSGLRGPPFLG